MKRILWLLPAIVCVVAFAAPVTAQVRNWPSERPPRPLAAHDVKFPPYAVKTLANGLEVIAVSHHEQPVVSLRLIVRAGAAQDPENRPGVASLAATLLDQGTTSKSAEQIADAIDSIGGALGTGAGSDLSFINAVVMKDSLNVGLDLVSDVAQHPAFAAEEIDRQRQQLLSGLRVSYDDPEYLANMVFDRLVYGFHPYGKPQTGTPSTISAIGREDLIAFHKKWFGANNAILAIVGDVTPEEAFAGAERAFGGWARAEADAAKPTDPPPPTRRLVIVDKPGAVQTEIRVGHIGIARKNDDFMALDLAVKILGGEGANRLHRVLRTERGLTYGASADMNGLKQAGDIVAETNTRSETTGETLRLIVDEYWKLLRDRVNERELSGAQDYLTGAFPLTIETPSQIALQILNAVFYGLNLNELQTYRERVDAVNVDDIQRVARAYLHPDRLTIVLVGDAASFVSQLPGAGFDKFERIPAADLDLFAADLRRKPATPAAVGRVKPIAFRAMDVPPVPPETDSSRALLDKVIAAKGGLKRLKAIRTVRAEAVARVKMAGEDRSIATTTSIEYPDRYRVDATTAAGPLVQVYADGHYWVGDDRGVNEPSPEVRDDIKGSVQRDLVPLLLRAAAGKVRVREEAIDNPEQAALAFHADDMAPVTLVINRSSGLVLRQQYRPAATEGLAVDEYSDYRSVDGLQVPFKAIVRRPGAPLLERVIKKLEYNVALPPGLFTRPSSS
jgi:zinc protease